MTHDSEDVPNVIVPQGEVYENYDCAYEDVIFCKPDYYTSWGKTAIVEKDAPNESAQIRAAFVRYLRSLLPPPVAGRVAERVFIAGILSVPIGIAFTLALLAANSPMWRGW